MKRRRKRNRLFGAALAAHRKKTARRNRPKRTRARARVNSTRRRRASTRRNSPSRRRVTVAATRRRRKRNRPHTRRHSRRRPNARRARRRVTVHASRRSNRSHRRRRPNARRSFRRRRTNALSMGGVKQAVKDLPRMIMDGAMDSVAGAAGWIGAQYGASLIPMTDSSSTEYFGLQPIETVKRVGVTVALGFLAKMLGVSPTRVRILVAGGFLNSTLSIIESVLPTNLAGSLGLYPGQSMLAGAPNQFVNTGFFPPLPGTVEGDGHGDGMGAYVQYMH